MRDVLYMIIFINCTIFFFNIWNLFILPKIESWILDRRFIKDMERAKQDRHIRLMQQLKTATLLAKRNSERLRKHNERNRKA